MEEIGSFEARTHFSDLLRRVERGEEFVVTMRGKPVARLMQNSRRSADDIEALLGKLALFRAGIAKDDQPSNPRETLKDLARRGMKW